MRVENRTSLFAWALLALCFVLLAVRYQGLPDLVPVYRSMGGVAHSLPKSPFTVGRIACMGVGQLGLATTLRREAIRVGAGGWERFWRLAGLAAAGKTVAESAQLASFGAAWAQAVDAMFTLATVAPVLAFLTLAAGLWRRRELEKMPALSASGWAGVVFFAAIWLACAITPWWLT
jgi:hypothetical protein